MAKNTPSHNANITATFLYNNYKTIILFAATGHIKHAMCARLHLRNIVELKNTYSWVYQRFKEGGLHTVRRSDKYWSGLWADLVIEQVMMRSIKSNGGLTRGRGVLKHLKASKVV